MSKALQDGEYDAPSYNLGVIAGQASCVAGPPQWEAPVVEIPDTEEVLFFNPRGGGNPLQFAPADWVRSFWRDGCWYSRLNLPDAIIKSFNSKEQP